MKKFVWIAMFMFLGSFLFALGELSVDSFPDDASVFVDNKYYGKTPILIRNLSEGMHEIMVIKAGEPAYVEKVQIYPNDRTKVMVDFTSTSKYGRKTITNDDYVQAEDSYNSRSDYERRKERSKVRMRNTILGLGLLNEAFTDHKRTRRNIRKVLGGLEILNELGAFGTILAPK